MSESARHDDTSRPLDRERDRPHPLQVAAWRAMGSAGRTQTGIRLRQQARRWKLAAIRAKHPDWSEEQVRAEMARIYARGRS